MMRRVPLAVAILSALGLTAAAQGRQPGDAFLRCSASHSFPLLTVPGPPVMLARRRGSGLDLQPWPADRGEFISGDVEVNADGSLANMELRWEQQRGGWPESWRTDVHPLYLTLTFAAAEPRPGGGNFDPEALQARFEFVSAERLRGPLLFRLIRQGEGIDHYLLALSAEAYIDYYRHRSAMARAHWRDVAHLAEGERFLVWRLSRSLDPAAATSATGTLSLAFADRLFEEFRTAERRLLEAAARAPENCTREVEQEPDPVMTLPRQRR